MLVGVVHVEVVESLEVEVLVEVGDSLEMVMMEGLEGRMVVLADVLDKMLWRNGVRSPKPSQSYRAESQPI